MKGEYKKTILCCDLMILIASAFLCAYMCILNGTVFTWGNGFSIKLSVVLAISSIIIYHVMLHTSDECSRDEESAYYALDQIELFLLLKRMHLKWKDCRTITLAISHCLDGDRALFQAMEALKMEEIVIDLFKNYALEKNSFASEKNAYVSAVKEDDFAENFYQFVARKYLYKNNSDGINKEIENIILSVTEPLLRQKHFVTKDGRAELIFFGEYFESIYDFFEVSCHVIGRLDGQEYNVYESKELPVREDLDVCISNVKKWIELYMSDGYKETV